MFNSGIPASNRDMNNIYETVGFIQQRLAYPLSMVIVSQDKNDRFTIRTVKSSQSCIERRIAKDCLSNLTLFQMKKRLRQILPRYIEKGK